MSPRKHDRVMAWILGFSHFIGLTAGSTLMNSRLKELKKLASPSFRYLLDLTESVVSSSPEFYSELHLNLPKINQIENSFEKEVRAWREIIKSKNRQKFIKKMLKIKNTLQKI
jgi:prephenate dehydrogenase